MARPLLINLITALNNKGIQDAQKQLGSLGTTLDRLSSKAIKAGAGFVAFQGGQAIANFAADAVVQARDLERNIAAVDTVFGEYADTMNSFGKSAVNFGLSQAEAAKASTFLGSVLKQSGFSMDEVATQTQRLVELGADLSITYGYDVQEALLGMTALFRGEYDPIEKFGVAMKQSEINSELAARGLDKLEGSARRLAEQQIRLELLYARSTDAQGAFARQSGTLFAEQQKLEAAINNMLQQAGTPLLKTMADLAMAMTPVVEELTPVLVQQFEKFIPVGQSAEETAQKLVNTMANLIDAIGTTVKVVVDLTVAIAENIEFFTQLITTILLMRGLDKLILGLNVQMTALKASTVGAEVAAKNLRLALMRTGVGLLAIALGELVNGMILFNERARENSTETAKQAKALETYQTALRYTRASQGSMQMATEKLDEAFRIMGRGANFAAGEVNRFRNALEGITKGGLPEGTGAKLAAQQRELYFAMRGLDPSLSLQDALKKGEETTGEAVRNFVQDFFGKLEEESAKVSAAARLEKLGASPALIDSIVNFGEGWEKVFQNIVKGGRKAVNDLQELFDSTADGIKELQAIQDAFDKDVEKAATARMERLEEERKVAQDFADAMAKAADDARRGFERLFRSFDVLPTVSQDIGKFEAATISALEGINAELESTLESFITPNGNLFDSAYKNLKQYAADELSALRDIQRQRDQLANRRSMIESITAEIMQTGNIVSLLRGINSELGKTEEGTVKVVQDTIKAGKRLKDFRTTIITNLAEPLEKVANKSDLLVSSYAAVVERTRTFVENLKALRQLGLDPQLFNQLVEAGVEAGGETAQALIDGGADTINEINRLTRDLNELGAQIGVETADVMSDTGKTFINSIIEGIQSEQSRLETTARAMADAFNRQFKANLDLAVGTIAAEAAIAVPPPPQMEQVTKDVSASLQQLDSLIAGAAAFANTAKAAANVAGALAKKDIFEQLRADVLMGRDVDLSGVRSGLSTRELESITGKQTQVNITIAPTINANTRAGGAAAAEETVKEINKYVQRNGSLGGIIGGVGQIAL